MLESCSCLLPWRWWSWLFPRHRYSGDPDLDRRGAPGVARGANFGSVFVPEDWIYTGSDKTLPRSSGEARDRRWTATCMTGEEMLQHLGRHVTRANFEAMRRYGIEVVRIPVGYWNFVDLGPAAPEGLQGPDADDFARLQQIVAPAAYRPFLRDAIAFAAELGMKVLLDVHALPGSQNGEQHSGFPERRPAEPEAHVHFTSEANWEAAYRCYEEIVDFLLSEGLVDALYGLQIINEPNGHVLVASRSRVPPYQAGDRRERTDLMQFYATAIKRVRLRGLPGSIPVVVFAWPHQLAAYRLRMAAEPELDFARDRRTFGEVLWDTHVYACFGPHDLGSLIRATRTADEVRSVMRRVYGGNMRDIADFTRCTDDDRPDGAGAARHKVIIGEWSMAGTPDEDSRQMANFAVAMEETARLLTERADGTFYWTWKGKAKDMGGWNVEGAAWRAWTAYRTHGIAVAATAAALPEPPDERRRLAGGTGGPPEAAPAERQASEGEPFQAQEELFRALVFGTARVSFT